MDLVCYYCLVNNAEHVPAVTMYDGATYCEDHAQEQARLMVEDAQERAERQQAVRDQLSALHGRGR